MMHVKFWGTRGSIATPGPATMRYGGNTSCVEVRAGEHVLIFDAGTGIRDLGVQLHNEFASRPVTIHLFLSHTHWDHIQGFPFFLPAYQQQNTINVYGPPGRDKSLEKIFQAQMETDYFPVTFSDMRSKIVILEMRQAVQIGSLRIEFFYLNHPAMCLAYRVSDDTSTVVYATDNEPYEYTLHSQGARNEEFSDFVQQMDEKLAQFAAGGDHVHR